ncbi:hypothetical protein Hanom_Chr09g00785931 [Helianthus anomalus]
MTMLSLCVRANYNTSIDNKHTLSMLHNLQLPGSKIELTITNTHLSYPPSHQNALSIHTWMFFQTLYQRLALPLSFQIRF